MASNYFSGDGTGEGAKWPELQMLSRLKGGARQVSVKGGNSYSLTSHVREFVGKDVGLLS